MYFGRNLQFLRKKQSGLTQEQLAEKLNVSRQTVGKWETEEAFPEMEKLLEISDLFLVKLDALIREAARMVESLVVNAENGQCPKE